VRKMERMGKIRKHFCLLNLPDPDVWHGFFYTTIP